MGRFTRGADSELQPWIAKVEKGRVMQAAGTAYAKALRSWWVQDTEVRETD